MNMNNVKTQKTTSRLALGELNNKDYSAAEHGRKPVHVAMFSGGASSAYVAYHIVQKYGKENSILFFTDTLWEDMDNYRFMEEVADYIGLEITTSIDGRTPEEVFFDMRFLGNSRMAKCSEELKVRQTMIFLEELRDIHNLEPILYFGIGPHEQHRAINLQNFYEHNPIEPIETRFPMIEIFKEDMDAKTIIQNEWGIKLPRMYDLGFSHANCGGRCVRGGLGHYALLYKVWPDQYAEQEAMEERFREKFQKDVSILKRNGGPFTLREYREMMDRDGVEAYLAEKDDTVPCVCAFS
ncbi:MULTISPECIES: phosphoadenosine phosphosulfate reductase domain-containing protein [unclassified Exiguobacterium]|jgi:3'-phosphoadenosine 5'-phosphosulfate sulfotransferase (PAPS reductase)/FAD synthetase|uniref:phosphoadenosine phosphosulfate reductase domain-containing protein n=1 Tax=unclassified Exiguobacterium TaxID=2644629 RepID=UPI000AD115A1|nr:MULTISPECIES: phosphoadenosine phosphosulfate reductase family protein [unclassified Exiguobacterium]